MQGCLITPMSLCFPLPTHATLAHSYPLLTYASTGQQRSLGGGFMWQLPRL